jgi:hypothetical protein
MIQYKHGNIKKLWQEVERMENNMTRLELLTLLLSIQALLETDNVDKAKEIIAKVITEAEKNQ